MKLKDINKTAGQQVQDWAVENQKKRLNFTDLELDLPLSFDWEKTDQGGMFWASVDNGRKLQELQEKYPEILKTPKEIAQNLLKGLSDEVLEEIRKQLKV